MILLQAFACAVSFLTRIPVPGRASLPPRTAGLSVMFFPVVGLMLGAASAGVAALLRDQMHLAPHLLWALLLVSVQALLTGALHLDGLSDVVDGLGGSRGDRERALEIMKDTHIGAFGVVALILLLTGKTLLMNEVLRTPGTVALLMAYPVAARLGAALLVVFVPCARATGLAKIFHDGSRWPAALVAAAFAAAGLWQLGPSTFLPSAHALGAGLAVGAYLAIRLRGLTGDAYGAAIEVAELAFLAAVAFPRLRGA
jgi:adenosylcobinamide-GDP ribazoletransferase